MNYGGSILLENSRKLGNTCFRDILLERWGSWGIYTPTPVCHSLRAALGDITSPALPVFHMWTKHSESLRCLQSGAVSTFVMVNIYGML